VILPRADAACGKTFYSDRRSADSHRIALEFWNQATGKVRDGYRLAVYRCKRCGGFHVGQRPVARLPIRAEPRTEYEPESPSCDDFEPRVRRIGWFRD
jgi:hypothetical protein